MRCLRADWVNRIPGHQYCQTQHGPSRVTGAVLAVPGVDPGAQVVGTVEDPATGAEAARAGAEVAPVARGGDGARRSSAASAMVSSSGSRLAVWSVVVGSGVVGGRTPHLQKAPIGVRW
jgi:hypothetical protein